MSSSLLAHLYPHIKGSQEDIATLSLQYLLSQSNELNKAFTKLLADSLNCEIENVLHYCCQVTGDSAEKDRPDMAGLDSNGNEVILCEMKFYASLTSNQPLTYLNRLKNNNGQGLLFICPTARRTSLWAKLIDLCKQSNICKINDYCVSVNGTKMSILTWSEIIEILKKTAAAVAIQYTADITQLEGFCNQLDSEAFVPFTATDLSAETAKKAERYYQIIDEVIELLHADNTHITSKKGLKASAYRKGYTRSLYIDNLTITLNYDRDLWNNPTTIETPFWVGIRNSEWQQTAKMSERLKHIPEHYKQQFWGCTTFIALEPLQNATLQEVCEEMKKTIVGYLRLFNDG